MGSEEGEVRVGSNSGWYLEEVTIIGPTFIRCTEIGNALVT